ncbi:MAG: DUF4831 family protein [Bacteroidales bacterium]|jgi:hypothetical protein|nr:DUF4831 family protein [Bacteroidales bacterium]
MKRTIKHTVLYIIGIILTLSVSAQDYRSYPIDKINFNTTGVYYTLPKTEIIFKVKVEKIQENKGVYADYAYLIGAKNIIINDAVKYKIKDIQIHTRPVGDNENIYFLNTLKEVKVSKTKEGALLTIGQEAPICKEAPHKKGRKPHNPKELEEEAINYPEIFEQKLLTQGRLDAMPNLTASKAVEKIEELREKQLDVLSGNIDGTYMNNTVEYMYKQLDQMINGYVSLFTGESTSEELEYTFTLTPEKPLIVEEDLLLGIFKFSEEEGVLELNSNSTAPIVAVKIHSLNTTKEYEKIEEQKKKDENLQKLIAKKGVGLYYRIPEMVELSIDFEGKHYFKTTHLTQYGVVSYMLDSPKKISFKPQTGALERVE